MKTRQHTRHDQRGLASLIVVSVLVVLLTLISLGFARLMSRSSINSANRQLSNAATYAAQSGINDVVDYMKQYAAANPSNPYVASPECSGNNSLIGSDTSKGPFYRDSNLSGDSDRNVKYSCILLNQTPTNLVYTGVPVLKSQVVRLNTSAFPGSFNSIMLSWQATNSLLNAYPPASPTLYDETSWNNSSYTPMLRVTMYPVPYSGSTSNLQANSKTFYLYPQPDSGGVIQQSLYDTGLKNGQILPVNCNSTSNPIFNGKPDYKCNLIIGNLLNSVSDPVGDPLKYVYMRITPIYGQADIEIMANDIFHQPLRFIGVQAVVDVTATTSNVAKRLQARVNIGDETSSINDNISASSNDLPEFAIRSSDALCKQITVHNNYYKYITFDGTSSAICNTSPNIVIPAPTLTFTITGNNGTDNGRTVDSEANNPDSPQSPVQKGTVYIGNSPNSPTGAATLNWNTSDATSCQASGGWSGQVLDNPPFNTTWSTSKATGSYGVAPMNTITNYILTCLGPGSSAPLVKQVTAWPYPHFTNLSINPSTVEAGQPYSVNWTTVNTVRCVLSGNWPDPSQTGTGGSETVNWSQADTQNPNYSRTFTVTCYDPIGRSTTGTITIDNSGGSCNTDGTICPGGGGGGARSTAPNCSVNVSFSGASLGSTVNWSSVCDYWDNANYWWPSGYINYTRGGGSLWSGVVSCGWMRCSGSFTMSTPGTYCFQLYVWADYWQSQASAASYGSSSGPGMANSGNPCVTIHPPINISTFGSDGIWDNSPRCDSPGNWWDKTWWCHWNGKNTTTYPGGGGICADGSHQWTTCSIYWGAYASGGGIDDSNSITCSVVSDTYGGPFTGGTNAELKGPFGWGYVGFGGGFGPNPNTFTITCYDPWYSISLTRNFP